MVTKKKPAANEVATANGIVVVDPDATYGVTLASAVRFLGQWHRPSDKNIKFRGDALLTMAADAREGTIVDVSQVIVDVPQV